MSDAREIKLTFADVTNLSEVETTRLLTIRNTEPIRSNMYTSHVISAEEHADWVSRLKLSQTEKFFAVIYDNEIVGGVGYSSLNRLHKRADWAFYLAPSTQGKGIGSALELQFVSYLFDTLPIEKLNCEVLDFNDKVVSMHERFGFVREGLRRQHAIRDGRKHDTVLLGITREEWRRVEEAKQSAVPG